ncbi:MAG: enoyl-CoA hydratase/isomerase family protein [Proteobacteria bacterium]|nr:enoyl-CoA hydratase/isomerase family protein [Pseudomonadota bacterium]
MQTTLDERDGVAMSDERVEQTDHGSVRVIALARPPVNAIELELVTAVAAAVEAAAKDAACGAVVLTGAPGVFSAGIDTRVVPDYTVEDRASMLRGINRMVAALYGLPKPLVTAVSGHALGGGFVLALTGDARFAAAGEFRLGLTEVDAGIPFPAGPLEVVRAEVPAPRRLVLGSGVYAPDAAELADLLDRVVPAESLLAEAVEEARLRSEKSAYAAVKAQLREPVQARLRRIVEEDAEPLLAHWI